jgi:hypothetical protein
MESQPRNAGGLAAGDLHLLWGRQSCLQPPFRRLLSGHPRIFQSERCLRMSARAMICTYKMGIK